MSSRQSEDELMEYKARRKSRASSENIKRYTASSLNKVLVRHLSKIAAKYVPMAAIETHMKPDDYNIPEMKVVRVPRSKSGSRVWGSIMSSRRSSRASMSTSRKASRASSRASRSTIDETPVTKTVIQISEPASQPNSVRILPKGASRENVEEKPSNKCGNPGCESSCECSSDCDNCEHCSQVSLHTSSLSPKQITTTSDLPQKDVPVVTESKDISKPDTSVKSIQKDVNKKEEKPEKRHILSSSKDKQVPTISSRSDLGKKSKETSSQKVFNVEPRTDSKYTDSQKEAQNEYSIEDSDGSYSEGDSEEISEELEEEESSDSELSGDEFMNRYLENFDDAEDEYQFSVKESSSTSSSNQVKDRIYEGDEQYEEKTDDSDGIHDVVCRCAIPERFDSSFGYSTCECQEPGEMSEEIESYATKIRHLMIEIESQKAHIAKYAHEKLRIKMATVNSENFQKRMFYILSSLLVQISPKFMEIRYLIEPRAVEDFFKIAYRMLSNYARLNPVVLSNLKYEIEHTEMIMMLNLIISFLAIPDVRELYNTIPVMRNLPENLVGALRATQHLPGSELLERSILRTLHNYCNIHNGVFMLQKEIPFLQAIAKYIESNNVEKRLFGLRLAKFLTQYVVSKAVFYGIINQLPLQLIETLADLDDKNEVQRAAEEVVNNLKRSEAELNVWAAPDVTSTHKVYVNDCRLLKGVTKVCETYMDVHCGETMSKMKTKKKMEPLPVSHASRSPKMSPRSVAGSPAKIEKRSVVSPPQDKSFSLVIEQLHETVAKLNNVKQNAKEKIRGKSDAKIGIGDKKSVVIYEDGTDKNMSNANKEG